MRILFVVPSFYPAIGGVETATITLVEELVSCGHELVVLARGREYMPPSEEVGRGGYRICGNPTITDVLKWTRWCEVCVHANVNMRMVWSLLLIRRPWVVIHHHRLRQLQHSAVLALSRARSGKSEIYDRERIRLSVNDRIKRRAAKHAMANIAVSASLAEDLSLAAVVLPNCYNDRWYHLQTARSTVMRDLIFVGRFVSEKGHWLLVEALEKLDQRAMRMTATFAGDGPLRAEFLESLHASPIKDQITWVGPAVGERLGGLLRGHAICVIPSVVPETFGLIALEAMACGCAIVCPDDGAVRWVAGDAARVFKSGDADSLARELEVLHREPALVREMQDRAQARVKEFTPARTAKHYAAVFRSCVDLQRLKQRTRTPGRLRILVVSTFYPNIGGIETVFRLLVREWETLGHEVRVIHPGIVQHHASCLHPPSTPAYYRPSFGRALALHRWCDIVIHGSLNARTLPMLFLSGKPCIVTQHGSVTPTGLAPLTFLQKVKRWVSRRYSNITCSQFVADDLGVKPVATGNPYDDEVFSIRPDIERTKSLLFVGRIVSDKGLPLLLRVIGRLKDESLPIRLTVIGTGPEEAMCRQLTSDLAIDSLVTFLGVMAPTEVADEMRRHRILVVPSSFAEPFGIVALEGIACGCFVVASKGGGMPESVGPCGVLYENNSFEGLVDALRGALNRPAQNASVRDAHLGRFRASRIAENFLAAIRAELDARAHQRPEKEIVPAVMGNVGDR